MILEKEIEKYLVKEVEKHDGLCWKFESPGRAGVPDRIVLYRGKVFFVELKRPGGRLSKIQQIQHKRIESQQIPVLVLWNKNDVDTFIERMRNA